MFDDCDRALACECRPWTVDGLIAISIFYCLYVCRSEFRIEVSVCSVLASVSERCSDGRMIGACVVMYTVEPPRRGRFGEMAFVPC